MCFQGMRAGERPAGSPSVILFKRNTGGRPLVARGTPPPGAHETFVRKSPLWELPGQQGHRPGMPFLRLRQPALLSQAWTAGATEGGGEGGDGAWRQA